MPTLLQNEALFRSQNGFYPKHKRIYPQNNIFIYTYSVLEITYTNKQYLKMYSDTLHLEMNLTNAKPLFPREL